MQKGIKVNLALIIVFILSVLLLFINNLTTPRTLSNQELLVNGLFLFQEPKEISDFSFERTPSSWLVWAAAFFKYANPLITSSGIYCSPILKLFLDLSVCAPQYLFAGTLTSPMVSFSNLYSIFLCLSFTKMILPFQVVSQ